MTTMDKAESLGIIAVKTPEGGIRYTTKPSAPKPDYVPPARSQRALDRLNAEMEAGKARVATSVERQASQPVQVKTDAEKKSEGSTVPVFRPDTFLEYQKGFRAPGQTRSKDMK